MKQENTLVCFVGDETRITDAGKDLTFAELKKGMHVSVKYKKNGSRMIAVRIKVLPKGANKI